MATSGINETLAIINRYPIDLELTLGATFTERTTYTGIYNLSGLGFDMNFRVQCSENYYGPNCTTFCEPMEGVYTCDSEGKIVCLHDGQDLATNCMACLQGWNSKTNCATCLPYHDTQSNCTQCLTDREITTNCTTCHLPGYDPSTNCTTQTTTTSELETSVFVTTNAVSSSPNTANIALVSGAVGGAAGLLILLLVVLCVVIVVMVLQLRRQRRKFIISGECKAMHIYTAPPAHTNNVRSPSVLMWLFRSFTPKTHLFLFRDLCFSTLTTRARYMT